jgi:1-acyl-sn-glycerol-3-phosphate acyltransferase
MAFRKIIRFLVCHYYRRVRIEGGDVIARHGPLLICANHPNSLIDPILVGVAARRPVQYLAKAPLFEIPVFGAVLYSLGMIPAHRGQDDAREVRRNKKSLDEATQVLLRRGAVGIFPEGYSHDRMGLEMVRSGAARMAQDAAKSGIHDLQIVPVGLNYEDKERFHSDVWIIVGQPITCRDWHTDNNNSDNQLLRR